MNIASSFVALALLASIIGCGADGGTAPPAASAAASAKPSAKAAATASAAPTATAQAAAPAAFPGQPVPAPFDTLVIGAPPGAKLETGVTKDYVKVEGADYAFKIEEEKENEIPKLKEMLAKGDAKFTVDQPDGLVFEMKEKDETTLNVMRYVKIGDKGYSCSTTAKGAPKTAEKAKEAFDVCGTLKAK